MRPFQTPTAMRDFWGNHGKTVRRRRRGTTRRKRAADFILCLERLEHRELLTTLATEYKLVADDLTDFAEFGTSVAIGEEFAVVGASGDSTAGADAGAAYVYSVQPTCSKELANWVFMEKLVASDAQSGAHFGASVAIHGSTIVVGAPLDDSAGSSSGAVYIFELKDAYASCELVDSDYQPWEEERKLTLDTGASGAVFGAAVSISEDRNFLRNALGKTLAVGAPYAKPPQNGGAMTGAVYVYRKDSPTEPWKASQTLAASDGEFGDALGTSVAVSGDTIVAGAPFDDDTGQDAGAVYIYSRGADDLWSGLQKLTAQRTSDSYGVSVAASGDTIVVGAKFQDQAAHNAGAAYVYQRSGSSGPFDWADTLTASDPQADAAFGDSVTINDGNILVGAPRHDSDVRDAGAAYLFEESDGIWEARESPFIAQDPQMGAAYGSAVAVVEGLVAIGAPLHDNSKDTGAVYLYGDPPVLEQNNGDELYENEWMEIPRSALLASDPNTLPESLEYELIEAPKYGWLCPTDLVAGTVPEDFVRPDGCFSAHGTFTQEDIDRADTVRARADRDTISYWQYGLEAEDDSFRFVVRDDTGLYMTGDLVEDDGAATFEITIIPVNDAPKLHPINPEIPSITEDDTDNDGQVISAIVGDSITDDDIDSVEGIAVIDLEAGTGHWEYSIDARNNWIQVSDVSETQALLLRASDHLRYVPDAENGEEASITYRGWDQTTPEEDGQGPGDRVSVVENGGTTPFSVATDTASITVTDVNDRPQWNTPGPIVLTSLVEDDFNSSGHTVASIIADAGGISDVDNNSVEGVAVIGAVNDSRGRWEYRIEGDDQWLRFGAVSETSAVLLASSSWIRFVPGPDIYGTPGEITLRAWDQTDGKDGDRGADARSLDHTSAFSTTTVTASLEVMPVNDAPVLMPMDPELSDITEDDLDNDGDLIASIVGDSISDVDSGALEGIAVTGLVSGEGTWQFSSDGGGAWTDFGAVSESQALLLRDTDRLRFSPGGQNSDQASVTYRAWDQTVPDTSGEPVDTTENGGTSAFSEAMDTASIIVESTNDAPVLDNTGTMTLPDIDEDVLEPVGVSVASTIASAGGDRITDEDHEAVEGIAVIGVDDTHGIWEYLVQAGSVWRPFAQVAETSAVLLADTAQIRFVPAANYAGPAGDIEFRAWDQTEGNNGGLGFDTSSPTSTSSFSIATETATLNVRRTNDAPELTPFAPSLASITEDDADNPGVVISSIVEDSITDPDPEDSEGIAVTGVTGTNGQWEYSTDDGVNWILFGAVEQSSAVLLRETDLLRFMPDARNGTVATVTYRAWDQSAGALPGTRSHVFNNGGDNAFSSDVDTASLVVTDVNDAPVLDNTGTMRLDDVNEDDDNPAGTTVSALIASAGGDRITDVDRGATEGIAVIGADNTNGAWQYSTNGGSTWSGMDNVSDAAAVLLDEDARVRFVPSDNHAGAAGDITFRAWDQTEGTTGGRFDASENGGTTAFSTAIETATLNVRPINDAPILAEGEPTFSSISEDDTNNSGNAILSVVGDSISDFDDGALEGIAIIGLDSGRGRWQYSIEDGGSWQDVGSVGDASALLLRDIDRLRFVPDEENADNASVTYRAWDQTAGELGPNRDATNVGGTTSFSENTATATISVIAVNDAPALDNSGLMRLLNINEDVSSPNGETVDSILVSAGGDRIIDVDFVAVEGIAVVTADNANGDWQYLTEAGADWRFFGEVTETAAVLLADTARIRFEPAPNYSGSAGVIEFRAWDRTSPHDNGQTVVDVSVHGGTTAFSEGTETATLNVLPINDAPELADTEPSFTTIDENQTGNPGDPVSSLLVNAITDADPQASQGIAVTGLDSGNGTWQYSLDGESWQEIGDVSETSAFLLRAEDYLRFQPDMQNGDSASVTYRAWDQSQGRQPGSRADVTDNGGETPFSTDVVTAGIAVDDVNDAPEMTENVVFPLAVIDEDEPAPAGDSVATILVRLEPDTITDVDSGAVEGIAVTRASHPQGSWQYSIDGGNQWLDFVQVSTTSAVLLDGTSLIRFVPQPNVSGTFFGFLFHAWDQSSGSNGDTDADLSVTGGTSAFSSEPASLSAGVNSVNDAPILDPFGSVLSKIAEDDTINQGNTVDWIVGGSITDVDGDSVGVAVYTQTGAGGRWDYQMQGGGWQSVGQVSESNALLLRDVDRLRFVPEGPLDGPPSLEYRAWDGTMGQAGQRENAEFAGETGAFSFLSDELSVLLVGGDGVVTDDALVSRWNFELEDDLGWDDALLNPGDHLREREQDEPSRQGAGIVGAGALRLDDVGDAIGVADPSLLGETLGQQTIALWFRFDDPAQPLGQVGFYINGESFFDIKVHLGTGPGETIRAALADDSGRRADVTYDSNQPPPGGPDTNVFDGEWHHVASVVVPNFGGGLIHTFYLDGISVGQTVVGEGEGDPGVTAATTDPVGLGFFPLTATGFLRGELDDVRFYQRALGASEITMLRQLANDAEIVNALRPNLDGDPLLAAAANELVIPGPTAAENLVEPDDGQADRLRIVEMLQGGALATGGSTSLVVIGPSQRDVVNVFVSNSAPTLLTSGSAGVESGQLAGDANGDGTFDQHDLAVVLQSGRYRTGLATTWQQGDWNGDGLFDQMDIVAALQANVFRETPHAASASASANRPVNVSLGADDTWPSVADAALEDELAWLALTHDGNSQR